MLSQDFGKWFNIILVNFNVSELIERINIDNDPSLAAIGGEVARHPGKGPGNHPDALFFPKAASRGNR